MKHYDISILIPSRNEEFLSETIADIIRNKRGNTEILIGLDGSPAIKPIPEHPDVRVIEEKESIGQRAMTNKLCRMSEAKYIIKTDAHCSFDEGFDIKLMADMQDNWTVVPVMRNLHAFDWVCENGHRRYQGPSGDCKECGLPTVKDICWIAKPNPQSMFYRFDTTLHFQYWNELKKHKDYQGDIAETMSLQGSFFMLTREKYWDLDICEENFGSWGQQGVEVACKTWLSGGRVVVNKKTWYAHMFRTQGGDFGFPYEQSGKQIQHARNYSKELFVNNKWPKAIHTFEWLLKKFNPPEWNINKTKGIVYYTDNRIDERILKWGQDQIKKSNLPIVSVSLKPLEFGKNIVLDMERGYITMFKQILTGLKALDTDVVFLCEHDVLYHESHFDFNPIRDDVYYYNMNSWITRTSDGFAVKYDQKSLSGLCADRKFLIKHFEKRIKICEEVGFSRAMGFEPGTHKRKERVDDFKAEGYLSEYPNIDIKHSKNLTKARWRQEDFRDKRNCQNWKEQNIKDGIDGWDNLEAIII